MFSPLAIKIMLTLHASPEPEQFFPVSSWNSPAAVGVREWLISEELIDFDGEHFNSTERGKAWVDYICSTPLPEQRWRLPEREPDAS